MAAVSSVVCSTVSSAPGLVARKLELALGALLAHAEMKRGRSDWLEMLVVTAPGLVTSTTEETRTFAGKLWKVHRKGLFSRELTMGPLFVALCAMRHKPRLSKYTLVRSAALVVTVFSLWLPSAVHSGNTSFWLQCGVSPILLPCRRWQTAPEEGASGSAGGGEGNRVRSGVEVKHVEGNRQASRCCGRYPGPQRCVDIFLFSYFYPLSVAPVGLSMFPVNLSSCRMVVGPYCLDDVSV